MSGAILSATTMVSAECDVCDVYDVCDVCCECNVCDVSNVCCVTDTKLTYCSLLQLTLDL